MKRTLLIYVAVLAVFGAIIAWALEQGRHLPSPTTESSVLPVAKTAGADHAASLWAPLQRNFNEPLARLLLQVIVIVVATRLMGALAARFRQPVVVGEVIAGILLGPSLLGWAAPEITAFIFPPATLGVLKLLSQIGVCLFMFVVGLELEVGHLRARARTAVLVSHVSIVFPFALGVVLAVSLYSRYAAVGTAFVPFALFLGIALSITAFPVLARILKERGMEKTFLGTTATVCAAVDDVTAWTLLAFVVAIADTTSLGSILVGLGSVLGFVVVMLGVIRPRLPRWLGTETPGAQSPSRGALVAVLLLILASALATEGIGIHALFGAFLAGVVMPPQKEFRAYLAVRLESFSGLFLLPLFFAFSGLRTQVGLLNDTTSWLVCAAIIGVATLGKLGGTMLTARATGMTWNDSFALGALMNTRGLVELVALNIGYDLGILPPRIFAMMVLMTLVTTFMTGPLLNFSDRWRRRAATDDALGVAPG